MNKQNGNLNNPVYPIMVAIALAHLINDTMQAVIPAMFPILKSDLGLTFTQIGLISFALNMFASALQPVVGFASDKNRCLTHYRLGWQAHL